MRLEARIERLEDKRIDEALDQVERNAKATIDWSQFVLTVMTILLALAGFLFFRNNTKIKEALKEIDNALKEAKEKSATIDDLLNDILIKKTGLDQNAKNHLEAKENDKSASMLDRQIAKALLYHNDKEWGKALAIWRAISVERPEHFGVLIGIADCLDSLAKLEKDKHKKRLLLQESNSVYKKATAIIPTQGMVWNNWGAVLSGLAELEKEEDVEARRALWKEACKKHEIAVEVNPNLAIPWSNWGSTLLRLAVLEKDLIERRRMLEIAQEKCSRALSIDSGNATFWNNLSAVFLCLSPIEADPSERSRLLTEAEKNAVAANQRNQGEGLFNLACVASLRGDKGKCREWLEKAEELGILPTVPHMEKDTDMDPVRGEAWFKELLERQRAREAAVGGEDGEA